MERPPLYKKDGTIDKRSTMKKKSSGYRYVRKDKIPRKTYKDYLKAATIL